MPIEELSCMSPRGHVLLRQTARDRVPAEDLSIRYVSAVTPREDRHHPPYANINTPSRTSKQNFREAMLTKTINGVEIAYDESGFTSGPPVVLLTGWAHDMGLYDEMLPLLVPTHRVVRMCWRGHGPNRTDTADFGIEEQVSDTLGLLSSLDIDQFYLVSHSHGGWPALELADRLGKSRVVCLLMIDQIMTPPPAAFAEGLQAMQHRDTWIQARQDLFTHWLAGSSNVAVLNHFYYNMGGFGHPMWALSCRVIADAYQKHGCPMHRMSKIKDSPPIRHVFSHPRQSAEYRRLHDDFKAKHAFFSWTDLEGETHFPDLEIPERVVEQIEDLIKSTREG